MPRTPENSQPTELQELSDRDIELLIFHAAMSGNDDQRKTLEGVMNKVSFARTRGLIVTLYKDKTGEISYQAKPKQALGFTR